MNTPINLNDARHKVREEIALRVLCSLVTRPGWTHQAAVKTAFDYADAFLEIASEERAK